MKRTFLAIFGVLALISGSAEAVDYIDGTGTVAKPVANAGTTGIDYSVNKPTIPNLGTAFGSSGPYANYVLVKTIPFKLDRFSIDIENNSGSRIVLVIDDGTASSGALNNATVLPLEGGSVAGAQGGSWVSLVEKGRIQIYAASSSAQIAVRGN